MAEEKPKVTEPEIITGSFCTLVDVYVGDEFIRLTGCEEIRLVGYDGPELRIASRMILSRRTARKLAADLEAALTGHAER